MTLLNRKTTILSCLIGSFFASLTQAQEELKFEAQTIDAEVEIGYGIALGDVNGDGKTDILLADKKEFSWYENPSWKENTLLKNLTLRDNVCIAAADIDGDGKVEVAVGGQWNPGETNDPKASGSVHMLERPETAGAPWKAIQLHNDPTIHRMRWVKAEDGKHHLVVLPLHGIGNAKGAGENGVNVRVYHPDENTPDQWKHEVIEKSLHVTHNFDDIEGDILVGGAEGIVQRSVLDGEERDARIITPENSTPPTQGVGEVRQGSTFIAAIEPLHGNELVVYERKSTGENWIRTTLTDALNQGHALAVADLNGNGSEQVVVGWRKPDKDGKVGIKVFSRKDDGTWASQWVADNTVAVEDLKVADLDGDGKLEIIAAGRDSGNLVIFWNKT